MVKTGRKLIWRREVALAHFLDLPYESKCLRLHGHNYWIEVYIEAELNSFGMIIDFTKLKEIVPDHKTILSKDWVEELNNGRVLIKKNGKTLYIPADDVFILPYSNTTVELLSQYIAEKIRDVLEEQGNRWFEIGVYVGEDRDSGASYKIVNDEAVIDKQMTEFVRKLFYGEEGVNEN